MPDDNRLFSLAGEIRQKQAELADLRNSLRSEFSDKRFDSVVSVLLPAEPVVAKSLAVQINRSLRHSFIIVGGVLSALLIFVVLWFTWFGSMTNARADSSIGSVGNAIILIAALLSFALMLVAFIRSFTSFNSFWAQVERVLQSGAFYFFAGLGMLIWAFQTTNQQEHSSLTFVIAMLGVAIMLFGTGSQAAGAIATLGARLPDPDEAKGTSSDRLNNGGQASSSDSPAANAEIKAKAVAAAAIEGAAKPTDSEKAASLAGVVALAKQSAEAAEMASAVASKRVGQSSDWGPIKANAAIAGGAAVLTALFGLGVIIYRAEIRDVFADYDRYQRLVIEPCHSLDSEACGQEQASAQSSLARAALSQYDEITAETATGKLVHIARYPKQLVMLAFERDLQQSPVIYLTAKLRPNGGQDYKEDVRVSFLVKPSDVKNNKSMGKETSDRTETRSSDCPIESGKSDGVTTINIAKVSDCPLRLLKHNFEERQRTFRYTLNFSRETNRRPVVRDAQRPREIGEDAPPKQTTVVVE